jgi:putative transposase
VTRPQRRLTVDALKGQGLSQRKACGLVGITPEGYRYNAQESPLNSELRIKMHEVISIYRSWGFPTLYWYLCSLGYRVNHKRVHRLYKEESLQKSRRRRRQKRISQRMPLTPPDRPNRRWSMDFIFDSTSDKRRLKCLNVVDDCTREALAIIVSRSIPGRKVCQVLDRLVAIYGKPEALLTDNGPEFQNKEYILWALQNHVRPEFIQPGKPIQNAFVESFNSIFRDQCLNENWFISLEDAERIIEDWRITYNRVRPHGSLMGKTPEEFRNQFNGKTPISTEKVIGV